ncbi:1-methylthio-D-xylulose 5-phosphate methylsulfurylase [Azospirillaceae bacterium]
MSSLIDVFRSTAGDFRWNGVACLSYKDEGAAPFCGVSRQSLFAGADLSCELRYFEVASGGFSTLERHKHVHAVIILCGSGRVLVGREVFDVKPHDLIAIPSWTWHQFRAVHQSPLGFLCMVNAERDRPQLPTADDLAALCVDSRIAAFLSS